MLEALISSSFLSALRTCSRIAARPSVKSFSLVRNVWRCCTLSWSNSTASSFNSFCTRCTWLSFDVNVVVNRIFSCESSCNAISAFDNCTRKSALIFTNLLNSLNWSFSFMFFNFSSFNSSLTALSCSSNSLMCSVNAVCLSTSVSISWFLSTMLASINSFLSCSYLLIKSSALLEASALPRACSSLSVLNSTMRIRSSFKYRCVRSISTFARIKSSLNVFVRDISSSNDFFKFGTIDVNTLLVLSFVWMYSAWYSAAFASASPILVRTSINVVFNLLLSAWSWVYFFLSLATVCLHFLISLVNAMLAFLFFKIPSSLILFLSSYPCKTCINRSISFRPADCNVATCSFSSFNDAIILTWVFRSSSKSK